MVVLVVVFLVAGNVVLPYVPVVVAFVLALALFVTVLSLVLSVVNVYFRDVRHFVTILFQIWFYLTPILYPVSLVPERARLLGAELPARALYTLNPMVSFVEALRDCLYHLRLPPATRVAALLVVSFLTFVAGLLAFNKLEGRLAEEL